MEDPYKPIAEVYDTIVGRRTEPAIVTRLLRRYCPHARSILDLACGSGTLLKTLSAGHDVTGLDCSPAMLRVAKRKVPGAVFVRADMRSFLLPRRFDAVLCLFNSMNHLLRFNEWKRVFANVRRHLSPHGVFIFDVSTLLAVQNCCYESPIVKEEEGVLSITRFAPAGPAGVSIEIKVFTRQSKRRKWSLRESIIKEKAFPLSRIKAGLLSSFDNVHAVDPHYASPGPQSEIVFFVAY